MAIPEEEVRRFERVTIAAGPTVPTVIEVGRVSWSGVWGGFFEDLASRAAARAQPYARTTSWAVFAALAVTLIAALLGGTAGARRIVVPAPL